MHDRHFHWTGYIAYTSRREDSFHRYDRPIKRTSKLTVSPLGNVLLLFNSTAVVKTKKSFIMCYRATVEYINAPMEFWLVTQPTISSETRTNYSGGIKQIRFESKQKFIQCGLYSLHHSLRNLEKKNEIDSLFDSDPDDVDRSFRLYLG